MTDDRIRSATDDDWPRIWPFFAEIVAAGETYAFPEDLTVETGRDWWVTAPPGHTVVLEDDGHVLGSAKMGPNRPGRGDHLGTASFMVDPAARGRGIGRALASYVVQWHRDQGYAGIQFNAVVETNTWRPWRCGGRSASRSSAPCPVPSGRAPTARSGST